MFDARSWSLARTVLLPLMYAMTRMPPISSPLMDWRQAGFSVVFPAIDIRPIGGSKTGRWTNRDQRA